MATEGAIATKDLEPAAKQFVQQANIQQLQQIASGTTLAQHPSVKSLTGTPEQQTTALRQLIYRQMKGHADFRGATIRLLVKAGLLTAPEKEAKKEKKEAPAAKEAKPKKEKPEKGEKGEKGEKPEKGEKGDKEKKADKEKE